jgi:hypothetical protein
MTTQNSQKTTAIDPRFDRMCEKLATKRSADAPWGSASRRGALDLSKDGAQHRLFHSFYEGLLN